MGQKNGGFLLRELTGFALLTALLLSGLFSSFWLGRHHRTLAQELDTAACYALQENWDQAFHTYRRVSLSWQEKWNLCAMLSNHSPMEDIDAQFAQLAISASLRDTGEFAATCSALSQDLRALGQSQELRWWNLL